MMRLLVSALLLAASIVSHCAIFELQAARALDNQQRTSVLISVRNTTPAPVTIRDVSINGTPIAELTALEDPKKTNSYGKEVDWYDLRPALIPPGEAGIIALGSVTRELRENGMRFSVNTDQGVADFTVPAPQPDTLQIAYTTFDESLTRLTVMVRNEQSTPVAVQHVEFNGRRLPTQAKGSPIAPGMLAVFTVTLPAPMPRAADCHVRVVGDRGSALAWFRAFPASSVNYIFYGQHADRRDIAEKNMDVYVTHDEGALLGMGLEIDNNGGKMPPRLTERLDTLIDRMKNNPRAWSWYLEDDAGHGRPHPHSLVKLCRYIRERGATLPFFLSNPADNWRYAWLSDIPVNYAYHVTGYATDPTIFTGYRSLDLHRTLNAPNPVMYFVDAVGQQARWITRAEEELTSYAMLGRGAKSFGWFLAVSIWDQGGGAGGALDQFETMPWRYQEGAVACPPIWNQVGEIAGVLKTLRPYIAASAPMPTQLREDRIEVLPVLCHDDLIITALLNRQLRCLYPRDFPRGESYGGIKLVPHRNVSIEHSLPSWIKPARVLVFDHERGLRECPFTVRNGQVQVQVDAVDAASLLLICPTVHLASDISNALQKQFRPTVGGSPIRPDRIVTQTANTPPWEAPAAAYRAPVTVLGPAPAGAWVRVPLPIGRQGFEACGYFDPTTVVAMARGHRAPVAVDYYHPLALPEQGIGPWRKRENDGLVTMEAEPTGVKIVSAWGSDPKKPYGMITMAEPLRPEYDILEVERDIRGTFHPALSYRATVEGKSVEHLLSLHDVIHGTIWSYSELVDIPGSPLTMARIDWHKCVQRREQALDSQKAGSGDLNWQPSPAYLRAQVYDATYRFGVLRQCKSTPDVYVQLSKALSAGDTLNFHVYWGYRPSPGLDTPFLTDEQRPREAVAARVGEIEEAGLTDMRARISAKQDRLESLSVKTQAAAAAVWVELRHDAGALLREQALPKTDGLAWSLPTPLDLPAATAEIILYAVNDGGRVTAVPLKASMLPKLNCIAQVTGQVETLDCPADGSWCLVGADKVYAIQADGKAKWTVDLGENRRQQERFGPGRNIEQVVVRADGQTAIARTFRWNEKAHNYEDSRFVVLTGDGTQIATVPCDWKTDVRFTADGNILAMQQHDGKAQPVTVHLSTGAVSGTTMPAEPTEGYRIALRNVPGKPRKPILSLDGKELCELHWPPYPLHQRVTTDGRVLVATTQGLVQCLDRTGTVTWSTRRASRIDAAVVLEKAGLLAIAYKHYPRRWDWWSVPRLELLSLADGSTHALLEGEGADDYGHLGADLRLAASAAGDRLYLGAQDGRIYRYDLQ
jgi:outer membrane protein assembly factor BamB